MAESIARNLGVSMGVKARCPRAALGGNQPLSRLREAEGLSAAFGDTQQPLQFHNQREHGGVVKLRAVSWSLIQTDVPLKRYDPFKRVRCIVEFTRASSACDTDNEIGKQLTIVH